MGIAKSEQALIGALLQSPNKLVNVMSVVSPEDFGDPAARKAYLVIMGLWQQKKTVDAVSVASADASLAVYVAESLSHGLPIGINDYAYQIAMAAKKGRVNTSLTEIINNDFLVEENLNEILKLYQREMFVTSKKPDIKSVLSRFTEHVKSNRKRGSMGIPTGFGFLDDNYIQYVPGQIWVIGAYTSVGKTAIMVQKICNLISMGGSPSIIVVSTEMTEQQVIARIISNFTGVHSFRILSGDYRQGEEELISKYMSLIYDSNLKIYDDVYTLTDIDTVFRKADLQGGVDIGFIDYVQNCQVPEAKSEYQEGSMLAKGIQKLAKDVTATMICLSQVSNDIGRGNTDQLEYKGAGEWAAVADLGIMLQRKKDQKYLLRYLVKKNRHGSLLEQRMEFKCDFTRIEPVFERNI